MWREGDQVPEIESAWILDQLDVYPLDVSTSAAGVYDECYTK
jgi:hypothetical protein